MGQRDGERERDAERQIERERNTKQIVECNILFRKCSLTDWPGLADGMVFQCTSIHLLGCLTVTFNSKQYRLMNNIIITIIMHTQPSLSLLTNTVYNNNRC